MTKPNMLSALVRANSALMEAHAAARADGRRDLADHIERMAVDVTHAIGKAATAQRGTEAV